MRKRGLASRSIALFSGTIGNFFKVFENIPYVLSRPNKLGDQAQSWSKFSPLRATCFRNLRDRTALPACGRLNRAYEARFT